MRALLMTVLVSFQLAACVTGDNDEPTTDDVPITEVTLTPEEGVDIGDELAVLEDMLAMFQLQPASLHTEPAPQQTQLEEAR